MADGNKNFICEIRENNVKQPVAPYAKVATYHRNDSNYNNNIQDNCTSVAMIKPLDDLHSTRNNHNVYPGLNSINNDTNHTLKKAPIVRWHNGSPTVFPSSPIKTPDICSGESYDSITSPPYPIISIPTSTLSSYVTDGNRCPSSSSRSSGICHDSGNTEDLSSLADEKMFPSTPALTINRSVESLSPDKDTLLTNSPDIVRDKDLSLGDLISTDDKLVFSPSDSYLTSTNQTIDPSPIRKNNMDASEMSNNKRIPNAKKESIERETIITSNPGYQEDEEDNNNETDEQGPNEDTLNVTSPTNSSSTSISTLQRKKKPKIPDGGWGWVVVGASLVISMIADGVSFSFGVLFPQFLQAFGASNSKTSWIGGLFVAVPLLSGPLMSALVDRYGCRKMTILGGFVSGLGFVLSTFSNTIEVMYLTFGVISGLGLGLCYVTAVVSIAYWFDKKRTLAVGLGACGTGIGTFVYAPVTEFCINYYGWRGTVLLLAGTFFNMIVCGTVMRDPEWWILEQEKQDRQQQQPIQQDYNSNSPKKILLPRSEMNGTANSPIDEFPGVEELRRLLKSGQTPEYLLQSFSTSTETPDRDNNGGNTFRSVVNLPTFVRQSEKVPLEVLESLSSNSRLYNVILENYPSLLLCRSSSDKKLDDSTPEICNKSGVTMSMRIKQAIERTKPSPKHNLKDFQLDSIDASTKIVPNDIMSGRDVEETNLLLAKEVVLTMAEAERAKSVSRSYIPQLNGGVVRTDSLPWLRRQFNTNTHYFKDIRVHRNSVMYRGAVLNLHKYRLRASSCPDIYRNSMTTLAKENEEKWYGELVDLLEGMMDFSMFLELHFLLLSLSTILLFTFFIVPYFYLVEHLENNGYTKDWASSLIALIGFTNTLGMIGLGWAGDQPWMNVTKTYTWCLIACGISIGLMPVFTHNKIYLIITSGAFGLFFASNFSFTPVILVELIPLERFTTAYGLSLLCQGIGNLVGPPLAGWISDVTGTWELSFFIAGGWIIVSGILMGIIPYTKNQKIWGSGPIEMEREQDSLA